MRSDVSALPDARRPSRWSPGRMFGALGPGLITGAADDDPSGIATYSQTGALFGFGQLWTALFTFPLLTGVQEACGRIGATTGKGLVSVMRERYDRRVISAVVLLVVVANTINIGADLGAVAASIQLVGPVIPTVAAIVAFAGLVLAAEILIGYRSYARFLKWLTLALLAYPMTAFVVGIPWSKVLRATVVPHLEFSSSFFFLITGVVGTTISPYMFFWQTSQEVEEDNAEGLPPLTRDVPDRVRRRLRHLRTDTLVGMAGSQIAMWFIIVTAGTVLHAKGVTNIRTAADAAKALEPLVKSFPHAGTISKSIFAVGVIGLGAIGIPVLAGSASYAACDALGWAQGLDRHYKQARGFYVIIFTAVAAGIGLNFIGIDPIRALVFTAVFNGVASIPLVFLINRVARDRRIMGDETSGRLSTILLGITFIAMAAGAVAMAAPLIGR